MIVRPLHDKILIRIPTAKQLRMESKLIIPACVSSLDDNYITGLIVGVGSGKRLKKGGYRTTLVEPGDTIICNKYCGSRFFIEDKLHMLIVERDILALLPETT